MIQYKNFNKMSVKLTSKLTALISLCLFFSRYYIYTTCILKFKFWNRIYFKRNKFTMQIWSMNRIIVLILVRTGFCVLNKKKRIFVVSINRQAYKFPANWPVEIISGKVNKWRKKIIIIRLVCKTKKGKASLQKKNTLRK